MMRLSRSLVTLLLPCFAATLLIGCNPPAPKVEPLPPQPAAPQTAEEIRAQIQKAVPGSLVGTVESISDSQAAVYLGAATPEIKMGESIQFEDANLRGFANGTVVSVDRTSPEYPIVIVDFEPLPGGRTPIRGDIAVYMPR
jgi:hypothetical protein